MKPNQAAQPALAGIGHRLWPPTCLVCGLPAECDQDCCHGCRAALPKADGQCRRCALELPTTVDLCGRCQQHPPPFDHAWAAFSYQPPVSALIGDFKFHGSLTAGRLLAELAAESLAAQDAERPQLLVPVPLHWRRLWRRGFNQAEWLCRDLSPHLGRLPWANLLERPRATPHQAELPADKRGGNVRNAFKVRSLPDGLNHVALVDDVMTTGATLAECARVLKRAGVSRVDVWVVARA